jgi:hypothetical protein
LQQALWWRSGDGLVALENSLPMDRQTVAVTETLTDTLTSSVYSTTYLANLTSAIGGTTAYVGFTAATDNSTTQNQFLSNFQFTTSPTPEPSSIIMIAIGAAMLLGFAARRRALAS